MRWGWLDERVGFLGLLLALTVAFWVVAVPVAADVRAPDALVGLAQLVWWALCQLVALTLAGIVLRPPRA